MDQNSPQHNYAAIEAQIRECFGRVVYSAKTHEKDADLCTSRLGCVKWVQIILSAITTGGLISVLLGELTVNAKALILSTICSTLQLVLNAYTKDVNPGQTSENHKTTAVELWDIRESYLSILTDLQDSNVDLEAIREKRDQLQARLVEVYKTAPRTSNKAYKKARVGLKTNEELTFSNEEIDQLLPETLRKNKISLA